MGWAVFRQPVKGGATLLLVAGCQRIAVASGRWWVSVGQGITYDDGWNHLSFGGGVQGGKWTLENFPPSQ